MIQSGNPLVVRGRRSLLSAPAQIRASPIRALGSYLGCLTANRTLGQGCKTLGLGGTPSPPCRVAEPRKIRRLAIVPASCDAYLDRYSFATSFSHRRLLQVMFNTSTLAHRCRRGASTPSQPFCTPCEFRSGRVRSGHGASRSTPPLRPALPGRLPEFDVTGVIVISPS